MGAPISDQELAVGRGGRPRDPSRDKAIREAVLDLVAEQGYERVTIEAIAARAEAGKATVYRRWGSKEALIIDALADLSGPAKLPDTGSLHGDLQRLCDAVAGEDAGRALAVMQGLASAISHDAELRTAFERQLVAPRRAAMAELFARAVARGEMAPDRDVDLLTSVIPALMIDRASTGGVPTPAFARHIVAELILPAATAGAPDRGDHR